MLAISSIKEHAVKKQLETVESMIITCEFISHLNKDDEFKSWLKEREKEQNKN